MKVSKMDMVRQALEALGTDAKSKQIGAWIKKAHKTEMSPSHISNYKSKAKQETVAPAAAVPAPAPKVAKTDFPFGANGEVHAAKPTSLADKITTVREAAKAVGGFSALAEIAKALE